MVDDALKRVIFPLLARSGVRAEEANLSGAMRWNGTAKNDRFIFRDDDDQFDFVVAGKGNDVVSDGGADTHYWSDDAFYGQAGNDRLTSNNGNDLLHGGTGDDTLTVTVNWYDPAELQFPVPDAQHGTVGFDVRIFGGSGYDTLIIKDSDGYTLEERGDLTLIHTVFGGTIRVRGVEEFIFL